MAALRRFTTELERPLLDFFLEVSVFDRAAFEKSEDATKHAQSIMARINAYAIHRDL